MNIKSLNKKTLLYTAGAVLLITMFFVVLRFYKCNVSYNGSMTAAVESDISIVRDESGIPTITASGNNDAFFGIGFVHAQDRLVLMEYYRAIALAKLSKLVGDEGAELDNLSRIIGFTEKADNILQKLDDTNKVYLTSYIKGINISKAKNSHAFETLSDLWSERDVIAILLLFEWSDAFLSNRELIFAFPEKINKKLLADLIPEDMFFSYSDDEKKLFDELMKLKDIVANKIGAFKRGLAFSTNYNFDNGKTACGFNLDSATGVYPRWYPLNLKIGNKTINCVTASGLPFLFYGQNNNITFISFNLNIDTQDFYLEKTRDNNGKLQYLRNGLWKDFLITEKYNIKDESADKDSLQPVLNTETGPMLSVICNSSDKTCVSQRFSLPDESYINAIFYLPFSTDADSASRLLANNNSLPHVFLIGSADDIKIVYSGKIPAKAASGKVFQDYAGKSSLSISDINNFPNRYKENIVIAGDSICDDANIKKYLIFNDNFRQQSLKNLLSKDNVKTKDITNALFDTRSLLAEKSVELLLPVLELTPITSAKLTKIYFSNWDYSTNSDSVASTIFNILLINMIKETINDELNESLDVVITNYSYITENYYNMLSRASSDLFDNSDTKDTSEDRDNIFDKAFIKTLRYLNTKNGPIMEKWMWGKLHTGRFDIPLRTSFIEKRYKKLPLIEASGANSTIKKSTINSSTMTVQEVTCLTGFFNINQHNSFVAQLISNSIDADSEYYLKNSEQSYINMNAVKDIYKLKISPEIQALK